MRGFSAGSLNKHQDTQSALMTSREREKVDHDNEQYFTVNAEVACHATDGPPTNGPAGPSTANFVAINDPAGPSMAAMDGPAGLTTAP